jgi:hypothetical protein
VLPTTALRRNEAPNQLPRDVLFGHGVDVIAVSLVRPEQPSICVGDLLRDLHRALYYLAVSVDRFAVTIDDAAGVRVFVRSRSARAIMSEY